MIERHSAEFQGKTLSLKLTDSSRGKPDKILSYHGVIRLAMLSKAKRTMEFRDWAEDALFKAVTQGSGGPVRSLRPLLNSP